MRAGRTARADLVRVIRQPPRAVVSPNVLFARTPDQRIHRRMLFGAYPNRSRPLALATLMLSWGHWMLFGARRSIGRAMQRAQRAQPAGDGDSRERRRTYRWCAFLHGITPADVDEFELYDSGQRRDMWAFVFSNEIEAYHALRTAQHSRRPEAAATQRALLANKAATCDALAAIGVVVPERIAVVPKGSKVSDLPLPDIEQRGGAFARPNIGNASRGACRLGVRGGSVWAEPVVGAWPDDSAEYLERHLEAGDVVVEALATPPQSFLAAGCPGDLAVVVRCITEAGRIVAAFAEVPVGAVEGGPNLFVPMHVDVETGTVLSDLRCGDRAPVDSSAAAALAAVSDSAIGLVVPAFAELIEVVERAASQVCSELFGLAWDVAATPAGPIVLEANTGWATGTPQRVLGPLVRRWSASRV